MSAQSKTANKTAIDLNITTNGSGDITGADLNSILDNMVDSYEDFIGSYTSAQIAALAGMTERQLVYDTDLSGYFFYTGVYWKPICCTGNLYSTSVQTATTAVITEETLATCTIDAGILARDGDWLEIICNGTLAANNNGKNIRIYFGASVGDSGTGTLNNKTWVAKMVVIRTSATTQDCFYIIESNTVSGNWGAGSKTVFSSFVTGAETLSNAITISLKAENAVASANDIVHKSTVIVLHRK